MKTYKVGYLIGSLSSTLINRVLSKALVTLICRVLAVVKDSGEVESA